ncbi:MAG TPA: dienelactone hydrolase family protein [Ramlibacter sp.]|uniref:dienelactone hydrolase family protein n=1 Tax=Ramlibacter sp. TaxID=1917967 RepID=UPI002ED43CDF
MQRLLTFFLLLAFAWPALRAQDAPLPPERIRGSARLAPDLAYPTEPSRLSMFSSPSMALYKPEGEGPFPALVLMHQCGGLRNAAGNWQNLSMLEWAKAAVARGYVVLLVDAFASRSVESVCMGARNGMTFGRGTRDALLAGAHLRNLPYVDKERIAVAGYSWGAMVAVMASGQRWADALGDGFRFRAAAAFYPGCFTIRPPNSPSYEIVNGDIDRPLLVLMGGQDTETPAAECTGKLEPLKAAGAPVSLHLYPEATHCWDCRNLNNFRKVDSRGNQVVYRYDEKVLRDSEQRMFDFLDQSMPRK